MNSGSIFNLGSFFEDLNDQIHSMTHSIHKSSNGKSFTQHYFASNSTKGKHIKGKGPVTKKQLTTKITGDHLRLVGSSKVVLTIGKPSVWVEAPDSLHPYLEPKKVGEQYRLGPHGKDNESIRFSFKGPITYYITVPSLKKLSISENISVQIAHLPPNTIEKISTLGNASTIIKDMTQQKDLTIKLLGNSMLAVEKGTISKGKLYTLGNAHLQGGKGFKLEKGKIEAYGISKIRVNYDKTDVKVKQYGFASAK